MSADPVKERLEYLTQREKKLTREALVDRRRITHLENQISRVAEAVQRGLPHMNLSAYLDAPKQSLHDG